jgi:hypothetical protein
VRSVNSRKFSIMRGQDGVTGHLFEAEILGECLVEWDGSYCSFRKSMWMVKNNQPSDPSDPGPKLINDLHAHIALELELMDWSVLRFYTAVGSPLDECHMIDGFFEYCGQVVTMDLTLNCHKDEARADLVIHPDAFKDLKSLATLIACRLQGGRSS